MEPQRHNRVLEPEDNWHGIDDLMPPPRLEPNRWNSHSEDAALSHVYDYNQAPHVFVPSSWPDGSFNPALSNGSTSFNDSSSTSFQPSRNLFAAETHQRHEGTLRPENATEQPPSNASRRSRSAPLDWNAHLANIRKLYIDEDNSLEETRKKMAESGFHASIKLYKDKIKEWGWSKYLSSSNAQWMLNKADKRKRHESKDTEFVLGNHVLTMDRVHKTVKRSKNVEHGVIAEDEPTPSGVTYNTPRNEMPSPSNTVNRTISHPPVGSGTSISASQAEASQTPVLPRFRITWDGYTRADLKIMHEEAHELDYSGNLEAAEKKLRAALDGLRELLPPMHEETNNVAYDLISFYAKNDRMNEADAIIQWTCEQHMERCGVDHTKTVAHILRVVDIFHSCSRMDDATTLIYQTIEAYEQLIGTTSNSDGHFVPVKQRQNRSAATYFRRPYFREPKNVPVPIDEPAMVTYQLGLADARAKAKDGAVEPLLLGLIAQCDRHPEKLAGQALKARVSLIKLYERLGEDGKMEEALHQAREAFMMVLNSGHKKTEAILDASVELAGWFVMAEDYKTADTMFLEVESKAEETFGPDDDKTINTLIRIGEFYQEQQRWIDARPRFEQALAASMVRAGLKDDLTKRLEAALDNQHYETAASTPESIIDLVVQKCLIQLKER